MIICIGMATTDKGSKVEVVKQIPRGNLGFWDFWLKEYNYERGK